MMKKRFFLPTVAATALLAALGMGDAQAGDVAQDPAPPVLAIADGGGFSDSEQQGLGCVIAAGTGLAATALAGSTEIMMLWGGGMLIPSQVTSLWLVLLAQIGVSGCAIGAIATPAVLWAADQSDNIAAKILGLSRRAVNNAVGVVGWQQPEP